MDSSLTKAGTGMDPVTGSLILGGANFLGGLFGGASASKQAAKDRALKAELARRQAGLSETELAPGIAHNLEMSPLRDQAMYQIMNRMGMPSQQFKPTDILGGTNFTPQMGGIDQNALNSRNAGYTPGAGGVNPDLYKAMLSRLGYMSQGGQVLRDQSQRGVQQNINYQPPAPVPQGAPGLPGFMNKARANVAQKRTQDYQRRNQVTG